MKARRQSARTLAAPGNRASAQVTDGRVHLGAKPCFESAPDEDVSAPLIDFVATNQSGNHA